MSNSCPYSFVSFCLVCSLVHFLHHTKAPLCAVHSPHHVMSSQKRSSPYSQLVVGILHPPPRAFALTWHFPAVYCFFRMFCNGICLQPHTTPFDALLLPHFCPQSPLLFRLRFELLHSRANSSFFSQLRPHAAPGEPRSSTAPHTSLAIWTHSAYQVVPSQVRLSPSLMYRVTFHSNSPLHLHPFTAPLAPHAKVFVRVAAHHSIRGVLVSMLCLEKTKFSFVLGLSSSQACHSSTK